MRHNVAHRKLGRVTPHRIALLRNLATALFRFERIETTDDQSVACRPSGPKRKSAASAIRNRFIRGRCTSSASSLLGGASR